METVSKISISHLYVICIFQNVMTLFLVIMFFMSDQGLIDSIKIFENQEIKASSVPACYATSLFLYAQTIMMRDSAFSNLSLGVLFHSAEHSSLDLDQRPGKSRKCQIFSVHGDCRGRQGKRRRKKKKKQKLSFQH